MEGPALSLCTDSSGRNFCAEMGGRNKIRLALPFAGFFSLNAQLLGFFSKQTDERFVKGLNGYINNCLEMSVGAPRLAKPKHCRWFACVCVVVYAIEGVEWWRVCLIYDDNASQK